MDEIGFITRSFDKSDANNSDLCKALEQNKAVPDVQKLLSEHSGVLTKVESEKFGKWLEKHAQVASKQGWTFRPPARVGKSGELQLSGSGGAPVTVKIPSKYAYGHAGHTESVGTRVAQLLKQGDTASKTVREAEKATQAALKALKKRRQ